MRAATWFDRDNEVVWLLGAAEHDERHKGKSDAYDILAHLDARNELFPTDADRTWLELDHRRLDTENFADDVQRDAEELVRAAQSEGSAAGTLAEVPARAVWQSDAAGMVALSVAVSREPIVGARSGMEFSLTHERFVLLMEAVRSAAERIHKPEVLAEELSSFPGGLRNERALILIFEP